MDPFVPPSDHGHLHEVSHRQRGVALHWSAVEMLETDGVAALGLVGPPPAHRRRQADIPGWT